jgi:hypothetical protein
VRHDGELTIYDVGFTAYRDPAGRTGVLRLPGDEALRDFLERNVGVARKDVDAAPRGARGGTTTIHRVVLANDQPRRLGFSVRRFHLLTTAVSWLASADWSAPVILAMS